MDAHVFRLIALELSAFMRGGRVEKIFSPAPGLLALTIYNFGLKRIVTLRHDKAWNPAQRTVSPLKQDKEPPAIYLTAQRLPNPEKPSTLIMTLRKYLVGHRLGAASTDWLNRRIYFFVPQAPARELSNAPPIWLCLDLINGASLQSTLPEIETPHWPGAEVLLPDHREALNMPSVWKNYLVLTPPLRKSLAALDYPEALALLADLEYEAEKNKGSLFQYNLGENPQLLSAWPLPALLAQDMNEIILPPATLAPRQQHKATGKVPSYGAAPSGDAALGFNCAGLRSANTDSTSDYTDSTLNYADSTFCNAGLTLNYAGLASGDADSTFYGSGLAAHFEGEIEFPYLEASRELHEPRILAFLGLHLQKGQMQEENSSRRRLNKILQKLKQEELRLKGLAAMREQAVALQAILWQHRSDEKFTEISISATENPTGNDELIKLDPLKTLRENMAQMFKQSDRGQRGLAFLNERKQVIEAELQSVMDGLIMPPSKERQKAAAGQQLKRGIGQQFKESAGQQLKGAIGQQQKWPADQRLKGTAPKQRSKAEKEASQVQRFTSSDGFSILRGKSAQGNYALLKLVQPHDLWLHVDGGPSAHVVIRRANLGIEIPERTLQEAGILSGLKSWRRQDKRADIITALVKDVRPVKGGAVGSVFVDKQQKSFVVTLDHDLEENLKNL